MKALNILLADDDKDDCIFFEEALNELQLTSNLTTVENGEQLMKMLQMNNSPLPDILFLDLNMPRKDGFSCLVDLKRSEKLKHIPVVVYSTSFDNNMADMLYKNGAHYFISKPADFSQLKQVIHQAIMMTIKETNAQPPPRQNFVLGKSNTFLW